MKVNWWTAEQDATILRMTGEGEPASVVGKAIGRTKAAVISRNRRLRDGRVKSNDPSRTKNRFTPAEDAIILEMSDAGKSGAAIAIVLGHSSSSIIKRARLLGKPLHGKSGPEKRPPPPPQSNVVQFPAERVRRQPARPQGKAPPVLRVVSNNVPLMVEDWLKRNGGPRRFGERETTETWMVRQYLSDRGIKVTVLRGKWKIVRGPGRPKICRWDGVMAVVDEVRLAEGLQPFAANSKAPTFAKAIGADQ